MRELRFTLVTTFYPPFNFGGDGIHVARLADGLAQRGHRVQVVHAPDAFSLLGGQPGNQATENVDGLTVHPVHQGRAGVLATHLTGHPLGYRRQLRQLLDNADVVHFHNPSLLGGPAALTTSAPATLYTAHEHWLLCPTHVLFRYGREVCTKRTCWRCTVAHHRPPQFWRSSRLLEKHLQDVDLLLCPSEFTARLHRDAFPHAPIEVLALPGPDAEVARGLPPTPARPRPYVLYAGRFEPIKGVLEMAEACGAVRQADVLFVGAGGLDEKLRQIADQHDHMEVLGPRSTPEVLALCRDALAVVVPSAGYETYGGIAVEAMAVGTPALVRDLGPLPELVAHGGGLTFGHHRELPALIDQLATEPARHSTLVQQARQHYLAARTEERFFARYLELVESVLEGERPPRRRLTAGGSP